MHSDHGIKIYCISCNGFFSLFGEELGAPELSMAQSLHRFVSQTEEKMINQSHRTAIFNQCAMADTLYVLQEFLKHALLDYLVRGTDLFSLRLSNLRNENSEHNSCPV